METSEKIGEIDKAFPTLWRFRTDEALLYCERNNRPIERRHAEALRCWIEYGISPGGFMQAVIENDLMNAMARADAGSKTALPGILLLLYNECPSLCHGNEDVVREWKERAEEGHRRMNRSTANANQREDW